MADAFFLAFQIPNLFRRLLGEGALSSAFIPVFKETERKEGVAAAWRVGLACTWAVFLACTAICAASLLCKCPQRFCHKLTVPLVAKLG